MIIQRKRVAKRLASGLLAGALALGGLAISSGSVSAKTPVTGSSAIATDGRVGGLNRWETATKAADGFLARRGSLSSWNSIVVASGNNFPDALAASGLAGGLNAPIILLPSDGSMPEAVYEWALSRRVQIQANSALGVPFTVYVVGGESAVPESGVTALMDTINKGDATPAGTKRIKGDTRAETARLIALEKSAAGANLVFSPTKPIFIVNENSFADALAIAPYAFNAAAPVLLTSSGSLGADAAAVLSSYLLLSASPEIVILGGTSAVSTAVEEGILALGFSYSSIYRVSGTDRYETSTAIADWIATKSGSFDNSQVTFANGLSFADGLAGAPLTGYGSSNTARTLVLVRPEAVPTSVSTWVTKLAAGTNKFPTNMYVLGGTSAVSDAVPTAVIAATSSVNTTSSLTCVENGASNLITVTVPGNITGGTVNGVLSPLGNEIGLIKAQQFLVNGAPNSVSGTATSLSYNVLTNTTSGYVTVSAGDLTAGNVISWPGLSELNNTAGKRVIGASSCTIADDNVKPQATIDARVQTANADTGAFYVNFTEVVTGVSTSALTTSIATQSATTSTATLVGTAGVSTLWKFVLKDAGGTAIKLQAGDIVTIAANTATDSAQNAGPSVAAVKTINAITDADVTAATHTGAMVCTQGQQTQLLNKAGGSLAITSTAFGPQGVAGNLYSFKVTNVRGQLIPKVTIDDTASSIVLTADLAYSSPNDVIRSMNNDGIIGWAVTSSATATAAIGVTNANTVASSYLNSTQKGTQSCKITITSSENVKGLSGGPTADVVVNGASYGAKALTASGSTKHTLADITTIPLPVAAGTTSVTLPTGGIRDTAGNASATLVNF